MNENDKVNHPSHYTQGGIECIAAIKASMSIEAFMGYCKGNVLKYVWRFEHKDGTTDLEKARVYLQWLTDAAREREEYQSLIQEFREFALGETHEPPEG